VRNNRKVREVNHMNEMECVQVLFTSYM